MTPTSIRISENGKRDIPDMLWLLPQSQMPTTVYPFYMASRAKRGLLAALTDAEQIIASVGDVQSLGNSRYAIPVTDTGGTKYRITIETVDP